MEAGSPRFRGEELAARLRELPPARRYWVGFSGGADSTALLQMMHEVREQLSAPLHAVHFNHGLQPDAAQWQNHCETFCRARSVPLLARQLSIGADDGNGPEESARNARYLAVAKLLGRHEMYLTAHHAEDQAETLLINLLRGSGIEGLAAIPAIRSLGEGWVVRPLLEVSRQSLIDFLHSRDIAWLEDPSNSDIAFDRNFIRHRVLPLLETRWPGVRNNLVRTAGHARTGARALAVLIEKQSGSLLQDPHRMPLDALLGFEPDLQPLILRQWLRRHEVPMLPGARLVEFLDQLRHADPESRPEVRWNGWAIRRYRDTLWLQTAEPVRPCADKSWETGMVLELGPDAGSYRLAGDTVRIPPNWKVSPRRPGDRLRTRADGPGRKIKDLFQQAGVPPWLRLGIPVLYWDDVPVALGDWIQEDRLRRWLADRDLELVWKPNQAALVRIRRANHARMNRHE
mgnify:FL=1